jgi:hypothetical protein
MNENEMDMMDENEILNEIEMDMMDENEILDEIGKIGVRRNLQFKVVNGLIHLYPLEDVIEHNTSNLCACNPTIENGVVIHCSLDRREMFE